MVTLPEAHRESIFKAIAKIQHAAIVRRQFAGYLPWVNGATFAALVYALGSSHDDFALRGSLGVAVAATCVFLHYKRSEENRHVWHLVESLSDAYHLLVFPSEDHPSDLKSWSWRWTYRYLATSMRDWSPKPLDDMPFSDVTHIEFERKVGDLKMKWLEMDEEERRRLTDTDLSGS